MYEASFIYLSTCTRWFDANSKIQLTRAMSNPRDDHVLAAKNVLQHFDRAPDLCVRYTKDFTPQRYSDVSHSDDPNNSRSVSGNLYMFAGGPVTWSLKKETVVALSSFELEYIALENASQEPVYLSDLMIELTSCRFLLGRCTRPTWELFGYQILQYSRRGQNT